MKVIVRNKTGEVVATYKCTNYDLATVNDMLKKVFNKSYRISYRLEG